MPSNIFLPSKLPTRVAVLWSHLSGYLNACLHELRNRNVQLLVSSFRAAVVAPFDKDQFEWLKSDCRALEWENSAAIDREKLLAELTDFAPQVVLVSGWNHGAYRFIARKLRNKTVRLLCMDNPWEERPKQWLGRIVAPFYVRPLFEGAFVPGERQFQFARRLGFEDGQIVTGMYAPDTARFSPPQGQKHLGKRTGFLFVGRLSEEKGISTLIGAYRKYWESSSDPWPLTIAGTGPLRNLLTDVPGINDVGFVQPVSLPQFFHNHACLVVPSHREPWGVQISEGTTAGLSVIATSVCGSAVHLVRDRCNGLIVPPNQPDPLARAMRLISEMPNRDHLHENSLALARQFTPSIWVDNLLSHPAI